MVPEVVPIMVIAVIELGYVTPLVSLCGDRGKE
jgi:hypothetical protein